AATSFHAVLLARSRSTRCRCFGRLSSLRERSERAWEPAIVGLRNGTLVVASSSLAGLSLQAAAAASAVVELMLVLGLAESIRRQRAESNSLRTVLAPTIATLQPTRGGWKGTHARSKFVEPRSAFRTLPVGVGGDLAGKA